MRPERVELPTYGFVVRRSIQLSYGRRLGSVAQTFLASGCGTETFENCFELVEVDWLDEIIGGALLHGLDDNASVGDAGQHEDRTLRLSFTNSGDELESVNVWHQEIQTNQIKALDFHQAQHFAGVGNGDERMAVALQPMADKTEDIGFVVNEKNSHCRKNGKGVTRGGNEESYSIPLLKGECAAKQRVRGKETNSLPLIRRCAPPSPFRRRMGSPASPFFVDQEQPLVEPQFRHL
jgi:hypothetical protein